MQFEAKLEYLPNIMTFLRQQLSRIQLERTERKKIELALEEAVVNIIHYAYNDIPGMIDITCTFQGNKQFDICIMDHGIPFNPLFFPIDVDKQAPLENRKEGGLGIYFILEIMDEIDYVREGEKNILHLRKFLKPAD